MTVPSCESDAVNVTFVGSFNPAIFQPRWMAEQELLEKAAADEAKLNVISPDLCSFGAGGWLDVLVTHDRFQAQAAFAYAPSLRDFVVGLFRILEHTPVTYVGINRLMHFRLAEASDRETLGQRLAPSRAWPDIFPTAKMRSLRMEGQRSSSPAQSTSVTVEPSLVLPVNGVFISTNEQYKIDDVRAAVELVRSHFDNSITFSRGLADALLTTPTGGEER